MSSPFSLRSQVFVRQTRPPPSRRACIRGVCTHLWKQLVQIDQRYSIHPPGVKSINASRFVYLKAEHFVNTTLPRRTKAIGGGGRTRTPSSCNIHVTRRRRRQRRGLFLYLDIIRTDITDALTRARTISFNPAHRQSWRPPADSQSPTPRTRRYTDSRTSHPRRSCGITAAAPVSTPEQPDPQTRSGRIHIHIRLCTS